MEDVEDEMNGNGVCSPSFLLAEDSCFPVVDARGEGVLDLANSRGDQQSDALDAAELADTSEGEHTLWHHVSQPPDLSFAASGELVPYLSMEPALSPQSQGDSAEAVRVSAFDRDGHVVASSDARVDYGSLLANAVLALPGLELPVGTVVDHLSVELLAGAEEGSPVVRSEKINVGHGFFLAGARDRILVELGRSLGTSSAFATWDSADGPSQFNAYVAGRPHALRLASAREFGSLALETHAQGLEYAEMGEHLLAVGGVSSGASLLQLAAELRELERSYYALRDFNAGTWERSEA